MITRLQLGVARLEGLEKRVLETFLDPSWLHLGDTEAPAQRRDPGHYLRLFRKHPVDFLKRALREVTGRSDLPQRSPEEVAAMYQRTNFAPFYFAKGDRLDLESETFDYVFSEHFFHHLFFDEAFSLFLECRRVMKPGAVMRVVVPDADLRTYAPPEAVGFPDVSMSFLSPLKHKTRYSVYLLTEGLRLAGFDPVPLRYCNRRGEYVKRDPAGIRERYTGCPEPELVYDLGHVMRIDSLIVDGIKRPGAEAPAR